MYSRPIWYVLPYSAATDSAIRPGRPQVTTLLALLWLAGGHHWTASYYDSGHLTASGAHFDPRGMTCASPYLPFGTRLLVCANGHAAVVTVTDRGPFATDSLGHAVYPLRPHPTRALDLSLGVAKRLHMIEQGTTGVRVWRLPPLTNGIEPSITGGTLGKEKR